jgi:hypothetical protein
VVALLLVVSVAVLCFTHYVAYTYGGRHMDHLLYYRYYRTLARRHVRVVDRVLEASLDDNATAQQRNVKLVAQNAVLRGKAIRYVLRYRDATRHLRRKSLLHRLSWIMTALTEAHAQVERARHK